MEVKNKTLEIHKQEAYEDGFQHGSSVTRESIGGYKEYNVGLELTKALYQLRQQIAQEIEQVAKENDTQIMPVGIALAIVRGK